jgi:hypothetical protein
LLRERDYPVPSKMKVVVVVSSLGWFEAVAAG